MSGRRELRAAASIAPDARVLLSLPISSSLIRSRALARLNDAMREMGTAERHVGELVDEEARRLIANAAAATEIAITYLEGRRP